MQVNQAGEEVFEHLMHPYGMCNFNENDLRQAIDLLCEHLGVEIVKTNATKSGWTELQIRKEKICKKI